MTKTEKHIDELFKQRDTIGRHVNLTAAAVKRLVPKGTYCYDENGNCPFLEKFSDFYPEQMNGYCALLEIGDWMEGVDLLWDQCKCCGINDDEEMLPELETKPTEWKSCCKWEPGTCHDATPDYSEDTHIDRASAIAICRRLRKEGFGGEGKRFPVKTWIVSPEGVKEDVYSPSNVREDIPQ